MSLRTAYLYLSRLFSFFNPKRTKSSIFSRSKELSRVRSANEKIPWILLKESTVWGPSRYVFSYFGGGLTVEPTKVLIGMQAYNLYYRWCADIRYRFFWWLYLNNDCTSWSASGDWLQTPHDSLDSRWSLVWLVFWKTSTSFRWEDRNVLIVTFYQAFLTEQTSSVCVRGLTSLCMNWIERLFPRSLLKTHRSLPTVILFLLELNP